MLCEYIKSGNYKRCKFGEIIFSIFFLVHGSVSMLLCLVCKQTYLGHIWEWRLRETLTAFDMKWVVIPWHFFLGNHSRALGEYWSSFCRSISVSFIRLWIVLSSLSGVGSRKIKKGVMLSEWMLEQSYGWYCTTTPFFLQNGQAQGRENSQTHRIL